MDSNGFAIVFSINNIEEYPDACRGDFNILRQNELDNERRNCDMVHIMLQRQKMFSRFADDTKKIPC